MLNIEWDMFEIYLVNSFGNIYQSGAALVRPDLRVTVRQLPAGDAVF